MNCIYYIDTVEPLLNGLVAVSGGWTVNYKSTTFSQLFLQPLNARLPVSPFGAFYKLK